jgi:transcriptional regulator with XRE-family HTH domain
MEHYIKILRGLREDHDKTQREIAEVLGTSQTMYARYERGANELPVRHLITLCEYYNVSSDFVLGLKGAKRGRTPGRRAWARE